MDKAEKIRILIADDNEEARLNIRRMLSFDVNLAVVGEACDGVEAVQKAKELRPHFVLMDVNMPRMDGLKATERINLYIPGVSVIIMSVQGDQEYLRKAMMAGARSYLNKPFSSDELIHTINSLYQITGRKQHYPEAQEIAPPKCEIVTVFGTKGGVGKTTLAVNLAMHLAKKKKKVVLLDLDLQFGDVAIFLNLYPKHTIAELIQEGDSFDLDLLENYLTPHDSGLKVLAAPGRPEYAELITAAHAEEIINVLKAEYDYIIVDTPPLFNDINLAVLDMCTQVLLVLGMDLATIKNTKLSLEVLTILNHRDKIKLILNRASDDIGITIAQAEETLDFDVMAKVPSEGRVVVPALNEGIPFVVSNPTSKASMAVQKLADIIMQGKKNQKIPRKRSKKMFGRLFKQR